MRCSSQHFICRTSLLPFAVVSGMATLEEALPPIEGDYVESPTKKAKLADHQLQTLNLGIVRITVSLDKTDEEEHDPVAEQDGYCERCGYFFYKRYLWVCPRCSMQLCVPRQCASRHVRYCAGMGPRSPQSTEIQAPHGGIDLEGSAGLGRRIQNRMTGGYRRHGMTMF